MSKRIYKFTLMFLSIYQAAFGEEFQMQNKVIKAQISYQDLNRISVKGDKIDRIYGVDNAFHLEKNDKTGEAFIRPTEDNGYSPISLSVVTISGKTQDLLLEPADTEANAIELVSSETGQGLELSDFTSATGAGNNYEEDISEVMKKFITSKDVSCLALTVPDRKHGCLKAEFEEAFRIDGYIGLKFEITTQGKGSFVLDERMFSQKGDVALSLSSLRINENQKATLYVLRK